MPLRTVFKTPVAELTTARYTGQLVDETGANLPSSSIVSLKLTIFNNENAAIINTVTEKSILNADRGTVSGTGLVTITLVPADNIIIDVTKQLETHVLFIQWTYGAQGVKAGNHEVEFQVFNREKLPVPSP